MHKISRANIERKKRLLAALLSAALAVQLLSVALAAGVSGYTFYDDDGTDTWVWAGDYIYDCFDNGIINGYEDGSFLPDSCLTRAEAAKMICKILNIDASAYASSQTDFNDVTDDHWALAYIEACTDAGIMNGVSDGVFAPEDSATRAQAAAVFSRMMLYINSGFGSADSNGLKNFSASASTVYVNQVAEVILTVTAIGTEDTVMLYQDSGLKVGPMYDDGTHGDETD